MKSVLLVLLMISAQFTIDASKKFLIIFQHIFMSFQLALEAVELSFFSCSLRKIALLYLLHFLSPLLFLSRAFFSESNLNQRIFLFKSFIFNSLIDSTVFFWVSLTLPLVSKPWMNQLQLYFCDFLSRFSGK